MNVYMYIYTLDAAAPPKSTCGSTVENKGRREKGYIYTYTHTHTHIYIYATVSCLTIAPPAATPGAAAALGPAGGPTVEKKRRRENRML